MLQLFTLGELRLVAEDGTLLSRRGKPLLLLTYLARRASRPVARSELAALLWGEREEAKARHSLRQALLELHRLVGDGLRVTHDSVQLDLRDLHVDAELFERDVEARRDREAVARWQGDFLADADDRVEMALRLWLETERAGLRRRLTLAFERLLDDAERNSGARDAIAIARRWTELTPLDEHACERLITTLRRAGHSVEALSVHTNFTAHVREALEVEPSRDFLLLAESLYDAARADTPERGRSSLPSVTALPLVGRASTLSKLQDAWRVAESGLSVVVVVMAEHGMGATRLCEELIRSTAEQNSSRIALHADTGIVASPTQRAYTAAGAILHNLASAPALGGTSPEMLGALATITPALSARFPHLTRPATEPDARLLVTAVRDALEAASEDAPVLVLCDALSAADVESRNLMVALADSVRGAVLLVLVLRPDEAGEELLVRLRERVTNLRVTVLRALTAEDIAEMLDVAAPMPTAERTSLAEAIAVDTGGIPLYASAAIQALLDEQLLSPAGVENANVVARVGDRGLPIPSRAKSDVRHRLRGLDASAQRVIEAVAVLGAPFSAADISRISELSPAEIEAALVSLERARFLGAPDARTWSPITPPVVERAVYGLIPPLRRESLHGAAAELSAGTGWRGARGNASRRAYHLERAGVASGPRVNVRAFAAAGAAIAIAAVAAFFWFNNRPAATRDRTVAIFPFTVSGGASVGYLQAGMVDLLSTSLDGVGGYHTIDPRVVIAATSALKRTSSITAEDAQKIAERLGATYYVLGTVVDMAGQLKVGAALYDSRSAGPPKMQASAIGSDTALFGLVDRITAQLAVAQGAQSGERLAELAAVTTTSLDALKAYLEGRRAYRANDLFEALPAFQKAVAADSSFALAWYGLASTASWMLRPGQEQYAANKAVSESRRLTARDRMLVEAFAAYSRGAADSAEHMATTIVETYDDIEAWVLLGEVLYHHNWKRGRPISESRRAWQRVLVLDPTYWPALQHLSEVAALEGRRSEADSLLSRYETTVGAQHMMLASRALRAYAYGDDAARAALAPSLAADRGFFLIASVWYVSVYGRDLERAKTLANMLVEPLRPPEQQGFGRIVLAHLDLAQGKWRAARAELAIARAHAPDDALEYQLMLSMAPFLNTPSAELNRARDELLRLPPPKLVASTLPWPRTHSGLHPMLRAYAAGMSSTRTGDDPRRTQQLAELQKAIDPTGPLALSKGFAMSLAAERYRQAGQPAQALAELERGARETPFVPAWTSGFVSQAYERYVRAELLHDLGRDDEALRWYGAFGDNSPYDLVYLAPSLYRQAQIYDARGQKAMAVERYKRFVELWKDADPQLQPIVASAKSRIALLQ
jgi:DNA-binding SARP family transcriptional activator/tetratricopeptide (TPR) repeat protein